MESDSNMTRSFISEAEPLLGRFQARKVHENFSRDVFPGVHRCER